MLAEHLGITAQTISGFERGATSRIRQKQWSEIAAVFGMTVEELEAATFGEGVPEKQCADPVVGYEPLEIPLSVHASNWSDAPSNDVVGVHPSRHQLERGLIRVRVFGDCMAPKFPDGCIVEFRVSPPDSDAIRIGAFVYVQLRDGRSTFKRIESMTGDTLTLRPLAHRSQAKDIIARADDIAFVGVAVAVITPI
jgi:hypothetical protein